MRNLFAIMTALGAAWACAPAEEAGSDAAPLGFADVEPVPAGAEGLLRMEDGVILADGTVVVSEQYNGMVAIAPDGSVRPFGRFAEAGYVYSLPDAPAAANGVSLEPDGVHVLVADLLGAGIYRVNLETEETTRIYQHPYGVNVAVRDSTGAIWFAQSTENVPGPDSEARMFSTMDSWVADGALYRIPPPGPDGALPAPELVLDGLLFANGLAIDEARGALYINETTGNRVMAYDLDIAAGAVSNGRVLLEIATPDNAELDGRGNLYVPSVLGNKVVAIDLDTGEARTVFREQTEANDRIIAQLESRAASGEPALDLVTPEAWAPLPGGITGVIFDDDGEPAYLTGLGSTILKVKR